MLDKLERKLGKYALPHLINYLIIGYAIGYLLQGIQQVTGWSILGLMLLEPYYIIHQFQFWRVITWVLIPPPTNIFFVIIMMYFYWQLGNVLEQTWGTFRFNLYIFGGILITVIAAFIMYGAVYLFTGFAMPFVGVFFSTYYINMSIFLAFAACYPEMEVRLYFLIPIKMKWMALVYLAFTIYDVIQVGWFYGVAVAASLLNFVIFYFMIHKRRLSPKERARQARWKAATGYANSGFRQQSQQQTRQGYRHKCAICGRTDVTNPELEFRYCSKCNGNYEYCNEHLFTHQHVQ